MKKIVILTILFFPSFAFAASLGLSPSSQSVNVGDTFTVVVALDTQGASVDGVDLRYLNYNQNLLQLQDANSNTAGVQIAPGSLMPMTLANTADVNAGKITFSQVTAGGGNKYQGSGTLATLTFKALAAGTADIFFSHGSGVTTDSNVAAGGKDVLTAVVNGSYAINNSAGGSTTSGGGSSSSGGGSSGGGGGGGTSASVGVGAVATCYGGGTVANLNHNLYRSLKGLDVTTLQNFLISQGLLASDANTGFFGPLTEKAVQAFQKANGLVSSGTPLTTGYGNVGPITRAKINSLLGVSGGLCTPASQTSGASVEALQAQIKLLQDQVNALLLKLQQSR